MLPFLHTDKLGFYTSIPTDRQARLLWLAVPQTDRPGFYVTILTHTDRLGFYINIPIDRQVRLLRLVFSQTD